jgi:hypothetical protein
VVSPYAVRGARWGRLQEVEGVAVYCPVSPCMVRRGRWGLREVEGAYLKRPAISATNANSQSVACLCRDTTDCRHARRYPMRAVYSASPYYTVSSMLLCSAHSLKHVHPV